MNSSLGLEHLRITVRTYNHLKSLETNEIRSLANLTVGSLLRRRGMGAKCVLDVLCALEKLAGRSQSMVQPCLDAFNDEHDPAASISPDELPDRIIVEVSRYPRRGQKLAPKALATILDLPVNDKRLGTLMLKDLDESVWDKFAPETCKKLADSVVSQIKSSSSALRRFANLRLPVPRTKGRSVKIQLEQRTFNCLERLGLLRDPKRLAETTLGVLIQEKSFGAKCVLDVLVSLESHVHTSFQTTSGIVATAYSIAKIKGVELIGGDDPRLRESASIKPAASRGRIGGTSFV